MQTTATANNKKVAGESPKPKTSKQKKDKKPDESLRKSKAERLIDGELELDELQLYFDHFKSIWRDFDILEEITINALKHQGVHFNKQERPSTTQKVDNDFETDNMDDEVNMIQDDTEEGPFGPVSKENKQVMGTTNPNPAVQARPSAGPEPDMKFATGNSKHKKV